MIPDTPLTDTLMRLQQDSPGRALYTREAVDNEHWETVWVICDESECLAGLGSEPTVEFRAGMVEFRAGAFDEGGIVVLPILLRVGFDEPGRIYDTCINAYQIEGENVYLQDLARQDHIRIHLYDEHGQMVGTLTAPNSLRAFAQGVLERQASYQPSTQAAFEYARDKLYATYDDVQGLWRVLGQRA
jgi:hypothetical protein